MAAGTEYDRLVDALADSPTGRQGWLHVPLLRLLASGKPVAVAEIARATGRTAAEVRAALATWTDTEYDAHGRIVGYGITLHPTPHRFRVDGIELHTWCALDTLAFPILLGRPADVVSPCRATGDPIGLHIDPAAGVSDLRPATAVISVVVPDRLDAVRAAFCDQVHFFASAEAAQPWTDAHPGTSAVRVADAFRLARRLAAVLTDGRSR